jgi:SAM-dependent methyltransferase
MTLETIECVLCGGAGDRVVIEENGYQGRRCDSCGLIFVSPRPTADDVVSLYAHDGAYVPSQQQMRVPSFADRLHDRRTLGLLRRYRTDGRLTEIGAGGGHFVTEARLMGFDVSAVELNPILREHIESLDIPCTGSLEADADILYSCDVLSHFHDPFREMQGMHDRLSDDGLLVLETGNLGDVDVRYLNRFSRFQYPDHLFFFGESALRELLSRTGFEVLATRRYNILASLWLYRAKDRLRPQHGSLGPRPTDSNASPKVAWKHQVFGVSMYFARYVLGAILPKRGRPQTMVVVAKRRCVS